MEERMIDTKWRSTVEIIGDYLNDAPVNFDMMASALFIRVYYTDQLPKHVFGKITKDPRSASGHSIYINSTYPRTRQRFTLAHLIAHYTLHRDLFDSELIEYDEDLYDKEIMESNRNTRYNNCLSKRYETQANTYAVSMIMPAKLMKEKFSFVKDEATMAAVFEVTPEAAKIRMKSVYKNN